MTYSEWTGPVMPPASLLERFRSALVGHRVTFCRLAVYYLLLYADCRPGDESGVTIWFDPPWRYVGPEGLLVESDEIDEDEEDLDPFSEHLRPLVGRMIEGLVIEEESQMLTVGLEGGHLVRTVATEPPADEIWHFRENATRSKVGCHVERLGRAAGPVNYVQAGEPDANEGGQAVRPGLVVKITEWYWHRKPDPPGGNLSA